MSMPTLKIRIGNWLVLIVIVCSSALLYGNDQLPIVLSQTNGCSVTLAAALEARLDPAFGGASASSITLSPGTTIEFVGRTSDHIAWIIRFDGQYALLPSSSSLHPVGCDVSQWGPPLPDYRALDDIMSATGLANWQNAGFLGQGIKVGVIDARFDGLDSLLSDFSQVSIIPLLPIDELMKPEPGTAPFHGTDVIEILVEIAPDAEYYVTRAENDVQFGEAVDALIAANVDIIVHAANVITPRPEPYYAAVRRAVDEQGILWINAAGNIGAGYYPGAYSGGGGGFPLHQFLDPNRDGLQFGLMVPVDRSRAIDVALLWEQSADSGATLSDFTLDAYGNCRLNDDRTFSVITADADQSAENAQAAEFLQVPIGHLKQLGDQSTVPSAGSSQACLPTPSPDGVIDNEIYLSITDAEASAAVGTRFALYIDGALPAEYDPDISQSLDPVVLAPADLPQVLTVGAFDPATERMAWYSSRYNSLQYYAVNSSVSYGPGEIVKPDLVSYGEIHLPSGHNFFGTSAATPVVGGAAVLIASRELAQGNLDLARVRELLTEYSIACLHDDGAMGHVLGRLQLPAPTMISVRPVVCGQYAWIPDISSTFVAGFVDPGEKTQERIALSRAVAERASAQDRLDLALLLSVEANRIYSTAEARRALVNTLLRDSQVTTSLYPTHPKPVPESGSTERLEPGAVAFNRDGSLLAVGRCWPDASIQCAEGDIALYDMNSFQLVSEGAIPYYDGEQIGFAANGELVTYNRTEDENGIVRLWNVEDGHLINEIRVPDLGLYRVIQILLSPDGRTVASADDMMVVFWDLYSSQPVMPPMEGFGGFPPAALAFSPDGQRFSAANYFDVRVRDMHNGQIVDTLYTGAHSWRVSSLAVSQNGTIASGTERSELAIWKSDTDFLITPQEGFDVFSGQPVRPPAIAHTGWVYNVAFVNNGAMVVSYGQDDRLILWRADDHWPVELVTGRPSAIKDMAASPDGRLLVTLDVQNNLTVWSFTDYNRLFRPVVVADTTNNVAVGFSDEEHHLMTEAIHDDDSTRAFVWDVITNHETSGLGPDMAPLNWIRSSASGDLFATEIGERVTVYDAASRNPIRDFDVNASLYYLSGGGFSEDLRRVVLRETGDTLVLRDVLTNDSIGTPLTGLSENTRILALSPDGRYVAYADSDSDQTNIHVWGFESAAETVFPTTTPPAGFEGFVAATFSPDSSEIVFARGPEVVAAGADSGEINRRFATGWEVPVTELAWSADDNMVILVGTGVITNVNDPRETIEYSHFGLAYADSGEMINVFESRGHFYGLMTSPNRDYMALQTLPDTIGTPRLFVGDISVASMSRLACRIANRNLTQAEWTQYVGSSQPYHQTCAGLETPASAVVLPPAPERSSTATSIPSPTAAALPTQPTVTPMPTPVPQVAPDILLTYDAGIPVFYLTNVSGRSLNLEPLSFEGSSRTVEALTWYRADLSQPLNNFGTGGCLGLWGLSVSIQAPPPECHTRHGWWSSDNIVFWTGGSFTVRYGGEIVSTCDTNANRCAISLGD